MTSAGAEHFDRIAYVRKPTGVKRPWRYASLVNQPRARRGLRVRSSSRATVSVASRNSASRHDTRPRPPASSLYRTLSEYGGSMKWRSTGLSGGGKRGGGFLYNPGPRGGGAEGSNTPPTGPA